MMAETCGTVLNECALRQRIQAYDFALIEMNLYLDTHPTDAKGLELQQAYREKRRELIGAYESRFGAYAVTVADTDSVDKWSWIQQPWPWECI